MTSNNLTAGYAPSPYRESAGQRANRQRAMSGATGTGGAGLRSPNGIDAVDVQIGQPTLDSFQQYGDAVFDQYKRRLDPQFQEQEARFRQDMVNRGLQEGTAAYDAALANYNRNKNDAYTSANQAALAQSLAAQQQAFGQGLAESQLANALLQSREGNQTQLSISNANNRTARANADIQRQNFLDQLGFNREQLADDRQRWDQNFGFQNRQWDDQFGLQSGQADFSNMMQLLGMDFGANQYNNQLLENDFGRAGALFGMTPQGGPTQLDVVSPYQMNQAQQNANYQAGMANYNGMMGAIGGIGQAFLLCDRNAKVEHGEADPAQSMAAVRSLPFVRWSYKDADGYEFTGTYAQDFNRAIHGKEGTTIAILEAFGMILGAIKNLDQRMTQLEGATA